MTKSTHCILFVIGTGDLGEERAAMKILIERSEWPQRLPAGSAPVFRQRFYNRKDMS